MIKEKVFSYVIVISILYYAVGFPTSFIDVAKIQFSEIKEVKSLKNASI